MKEINKLFSIYQPELVKLANSDFGRKWLGVPDTQKVFKVYGNGFGFLNKKGGYSERRYCGYPIYNKIGASLVKTSIASDYFKEVKVQHKDNYASLLNYHGILRDNYFPQVFLTNYNVHAGDGYVYITSAVSWDTVHNATGGDGVSDSPTVLVVRSSNAWSIIRVFTPIDTTGRPTVTDASLYLYGDAAGGNTDTVSYGVVQTTQADYTSLAAADFDTCGAVHSATEGATRVAYTALSTGAFNKFTLNATGLTWVIDGVTKLGIRDSRDLDDSAPTGTNRFDFRSTDYTGTASDPYLAINEAVTFIPHFINFI